MVMNIISFIALLLFSIIAFGLIIYDLKTGRISSDPRNNRRIVLMFYVLLAIVLVKINLSLFDKL